MDQDSEIIEKKQGLFKNLSSDRKKLISSLIIFLAIPLTVVLVLTQTNILKFAQGPEIASLSVHPGEINSYIGGAKIGMSALAYDSSGNPINSGVNYEWSISSIDSVGTLSSIIGDLSEFTPLNVGCGVITVIARNGSQEITKAVPISVSDGANVPDCSVPTPTPTSEPTATLTLSPTPLPPSPTVTPTPTPAPVQLLQNTTFEKTGSSWLSPWIWALKTGAAGTISQDSTTKVGGLRSAKVNITQASTDWYAQLSQKNIPLTLGRTHYGSFYAKASSPRNVRIAIQQGSSPYTLYYQKTFALTTSWKKYSFSFIPSINQPNSMYVFNLAQSTGQVWIDNVSFVR